MHQLLKAGRSVFSFCCIFFFHFVGDGEDEEGNEFLGYFVPEHLMLFAVNMEYVS